MNTVDVRIARPPLAHLPAQGGPAEGLALAEGPLTSEPRSPIPRTRR